MRNVALRRKLLDYFYFIALSLFQFVFLFCLYCQKQPPEVFYEKVVLRNFTKFTGKHLGQSLFLTTLQAWACNFIKKETLAHVFFCGFCEICEKTFFTEHLWTTASVSWLAHWYLYVKRSWLCIFVQFSFHLRFLTLLLLVCC